jgi:hypothetical protein
MGNTGASIMARIAFIAAAALLAHLYARGETYRNEDYRFSIEMPPGWSIVPGNSPSTLTKASFQDATGKGAMLAIAAIPANGTTDMWSFTAQQILDQFKSEYPAADAVLAESGQNMVGGEHALWIRIDVRSPPVAAMSSLTYHFVHGKTLFRISATTTGNDPVWFAQHRPAFEAAVATFAFTAPASPPASQPGNLPAASEPVPTPGPSQHKTVLVGTATAVIFLAAAYFIARRMRR